MPIVKTAEIPPGHPLYPRAAADFLRPPPVLSALGNLDLLQESAAVGFCGARHASPKGIETARALVSQLCKEVKNIAVVSGNAAGSDLEVHHSALKFGAKTILVLPEGIEHFRIRQKLREVWDWNRVLVVSQFPPNAGWRAWRAMARNHMILALSKAMIVVEAQETGGTKAAAEAAAEHNVPLFVASYQDAAAAPGNLQLYRSKNAVPLGKNETGEANVERIIQTIYASRPRQNQLRLA